MQIATGSRFPFELEMLVCAPIFRSVPRHDARDFEGKHQEIVMVGKVAQWGSNILLVGMAVLTYVVLFLAR